VRAAAAGCVHGGWSLFTRSDAIECVWQIPASRDNPSLFAALTRGISRSPRNHTDPVTAAHLAGGKPGLMAKARMTAGDVLQDPMETR
jgi:hypothetical protein